ncbi:MAG: hypothetical protein K2M69_08280 [Muribaculaceae bacterium]|nr:hypothetical protein [Muribaculaceae bacterium]
MKKVQSNVASLEPNVDSLRSNVASKDAPRPHIYAVGQKVLNHYCKSEILTIGELAGHADKNNPRYRVLEYPYLWNECELEPYIEPSNVSINDTKDDTKESRNLSQNIANCDKSEDQELKDNMEEKELNLVELLRGCEGEEFYSIVYGNVTLEVIHSPEVDDLKYYLLTRPNSCRIGRDLVYPNGKVDANGAILLYPSKELYEKYPLDAYAAWMEWKEARKPKRWTPQIGERIFFVNSHGAVSQEFCRSDEEGNEHQLKRRAIGNEFRTGKAAETFAKIFRETLAIFHEKNAGRDI